MTVVMTHRSHTQAHFPSPHFRGRFITCWAGLEDFVGGMDGIHDLPLHLVSLHCMVGSELLLRCITGLMDGMDWVGNCII
jgi:hypothetical protein